MTDEAAREAAYQEIQRTIMADAPWAPFRHQEWYTLIGQANGWRVLDPPGLAVRRARLWIKAGS